LSGCPQTSDASKLKHNHTIVIAIAIAIAITILHFSKFKMFSLPISAFDQLKRILH
jgi:hypothetical protein